jgi:catechol 2,3-dioxygenase-like lactoylglutathione lyase family enzyme
MPPSDKSLAGLHHVTAITADAQKNVDFYCGVLGLRLVKLTVNFDDPGSYHLYYGDELGRPGTVLTFFAWPGAHRGRIGPPQVSVTAFAVPAGAMNFWAKRLKERSIETQSADRLGERVIAFSDPDGMALELVGVAEPGGQPWSAGPIAAEYAIRGFHSVTICEDGYENTAKLLTDVMGFQPAGQERDRFPYRAGKGNGFASMVELLCMPDARRGELGAGVVHHVAFRTPDDRQQRAWRDQIAQLGFNISPIMDRVYFHSIYFREPGGVLFEIATENPGFTTDEPPEKLGSGLRLPPWLQPHQAQIQRALPPLRLPGNTRDPS